MLGDPDRDRRAEQQAAERSRTATRSTRSRRAGGSGRRARWRSRTSAGARWKPRPSARPGRGDGEDEREAELDPGQPGQLDGGQVRADDLALVDDVGDLGAGAERRARTPLGDGCRAGAVGLHEERADRVAAGRPARRSAALATRNESRRRGRELLGHAGVVERDGRELLGPAVLQPQAEQVAGLQLEVRDGLGGDEDAVRVAARACCMSPWRCRPANQPFWSLPAAPIVCGRTP